MAHEFLSAKLCELDTRVGKLHSRIREGELLSDDRLKEEIESLQIEISEDEKQLFASLLSTKADISTELRMEFEVLKDKYQSAISRLREDIDQNMSSEEEAEKKSLMAEYGIDFAMLAAEHSLLLALEAIEVERERPENVDLKL